MLSRLGARKFDSTSTSTFTTQWTYLAGLLLVCMLAGSDAWAQTITAYENTGYKSGAPVRESLDGVILSPFFNVTVSNSTQGNFPLYVYNTEVRSVNFPTFTSTFTGGTYDASGTYGYGGTNTSNLGTASFTSFQASGTNTVTVSFQSGYPTGGAITNTSQIKILARVTSNLGTVTLNPAGYPTGSFQFTVATQNDANGNGIPQQLTIEINGDWLNSLHVFINPAPNSTNQVPSGALTMTPGTITSSSFTSGYTVYHFPHGIYNVTGNVNFGVGAELYLDDGAFLYYTGSATATLPMITMGGYAGAPAQNAIVRGWGVLDGQSMQSQVVNATVTSSGANAGLTCSPSQQLTAPMCQVPSTDTIGACGSNTGIMAYSDMNTSSTRAILVDGVIMRNSCSYNFYPAKNIGSSSYPFTINNIKIINYSGNDPHEGNSDGIDVVTDQDVNITNSFFRSMDDLISLKQTSTNYFPNSTNPNTNCTSGLGIYPTVGINVVGNTFWNEYAHTMVVGGELYNGCNVNEYSNPLAVDDVTFDSNITIRDTGKGSQMGVLNSYGGKVQNVAYSNNIVQQATALWSDTLAPDNTTSNPGILGGSSLCNINMTVAQTTPQTFGGSQAEPFVGPVPNLQMVVALPYGNPYVGNGTQSGTYPQAIQYGPQISNVKVNGAAVTASMNGNDYYYESADGSSHGGTAAFPQNQIELTEKIRLQTNTQYSIWNYNSGVLINGVAQPNQVPGDMMSPQFTTLSCPVSSLLPVAQ